MGEEVIVETEAVPLEHEKSEDDALVVCRECVQIVPKTLVCIYCGAPILFREPRQLEK